MTEPRDFSRPEGWEDLGDVGDGVPPAAPPPPTVEEPPVQPSPAPRPASTPRHTEVTFTQPIVEKRYLKLLSLAVLGVVALVLVPLLIAAVTFGSRPAPERTPLDPFPPGPSRPTSTLPPQTLPQREPIETAWKVTTAQLRPDLTKGRFISTLSGEFQGRHVTELSGTWVAISADREDRHAVVHGLDAATGEERWRRPFDEVFCASTPLPDGLVCASSLQRDRATDAGTRWRLHVMDAVTGQDLRTVDVDAWLSLLEVIDGRVLLLEERVPTPHAVVRLFDATLKPLADFDLRDLDWHEQMFSRNRMIDRKIRVPEGPALDRPRIRHVGKGLTALWIGSRTLFIDVAKGRIAGMPYCSRLVDDGARLWCNNPEYAQSYSYDLKPGVRTERGVRLAFPQRDPAFGDVTPAVFLDLDGQVVRVDPKTGKTLGVIFDTKSFDVWGLTATATVSIVGKHVILHHPTRTASFDPLTGKVFWQLGPPELNDPVFDYRGKLLFFDRRAYLLDSKTGRVQRYFEEPVGIYRQRVGDAFLAFGLEELARLEMPD